MRPGNRHGGAEFAGANVEQPFGAAITITFHCAGRTKTSVIRICGRRIERVGRRSETVTLGVGTKMRCRNATSRDRKIVFPVLFLMTWLPPQLTSDSVVNNVLVVDERQATAQFGIEHMDGGVGRQLRRISRSVCANDTVTLFGLPKRQLGHSVPIINGGVVGHGFSAGRNSEESVASRAVFL